MGREKLQAGQRIQTYYQADQVLLKPVRTFTLATSPQVPSADFKGSQTTGGWWFFFLVVVVGFFF